MKKILVSVIALVFGAWVVPVLSAEAESAGIFVQAQGVYKLSKNKDEQRSLFGKTLFVEKELPNADGLSIFGSAYHDEEFKSVFLGVAKKFGDFQVALSVGPAWYDNTRRVVYSPWVYYEADGVEGLAYTEYTPKDKDEPWFVKGYIHKRFGNYLAGVYGENGLGVGPMVGFYPQEKVKVWAMVPVISQPDEGRVKMMVGVTISF